jgi:toxin HigB-1
VLTPARIRNKELRKVLAGEPARIDARWRPKIERMLAALNVTVSPTELNIYRCHELTGDRKGTFALAVSPNWRLTFRWDDNGPYDLDLEDYHG